MKRWLGLGAPPSVGIAFRTEAIDFALVRKPGTVVGLGRIPLPALDMGRAIGHALAQVHWTRPPSIRVAVEPMPRTGTGPDAARSRTTTVYELDDTAARGGDGRRIAGEVLLDERVLRSAADAVRPLPGSLRSIEASPVCVARFLRIAEPDQQLRFARFTEQRQRWTLCDGAGLFEVETSPYPGGASTLVSGSSPSDNTRLQWGSLNVDPHLRSDAPDPGLFTAAIGAALGEHVLVLAGNVLTEDPLVGSVPSRQDR